VSDQPSMDSLVHAVQDLTRVIIRLSGAFDSTAEAVRELRALGIPPLRVAAILGVQPKQVHAELAKAKKRTPAKTRSKTR
jgi:hypothetical protein